MRHKGRGLTMKTPMAELAGRADNIARSSVCIQIPEDYGKRERLDTLDRDKCYLY